MSKEQEIPSLGYQPPPEYAPRCVIMGCPNVAPRENARCTSCAKKGIPNPFTHSRKPSRFERVRCAEETCREFFQPRGPKQLLCNRCLLKQRTEYFLKQIGGVEVMRKRDGVLFFATSVGKGQIKLQDQLHHREWTIDKEYFLHAYTL